MLRLEFFTRTFLKFKRFSNNKVARCCNRGTGLILFLVLVYISLRDVKRKSSVMINAKSGIESSNTNTTTSLGSKVLPKCIIIGVRKGGTRALLEMLTLHPSIKMASQEVHFFDNDTNYGRGYTWYLSQMPATEEGQIAVEKSPSYLVTPAVAERIKAMDPGIQLLVIVREPVTRLVSDFTQISYNRLERGLKTRTFDETIIKEDGSINVDYYGVTTGLYSEHLEHWYKFFPREQIHIVNGDRLIKTPWREISKIENFLGLQHFVKENNFYFNTTKGFHCLRPETGQVRCLAKSKGRPHVNVSANTIKLLRNFYTPHNLKFYSLVGTDFGWPED